MKVDVIPLTDFYHGSEHFQEGKAKPCERSLAEEFERRNLVRIRTLPRRVDVALVQRGGAETVAGKPPAVGAKQPSSASPAAPASQQTATPTSSMYDAGATQKRKRRGASSS